LRSSALRVVGDIISSLAVDLSDHRVISGDTDLVTTVVAVVGSRQEAELIVGMLNNNGLRAVVSADDAGRVEVALQAQGVRVLVPDSQVSQARRLLGDEPTPAASLNRLQRLLVRLLGGAGDADRS
jgi:hypothetical protein